MIGPGIRYQRSRRADRDRLGSLGRAVIATSARLKANHLTPVASVPRARDASGEIDTLDRVAGGLRRWSAELDQIRGCEHSAGREAVVNASRVRSDRGGADSHHVAACKSLEWPDEGAERREYEHARELLVAVDALGDESPEQYRTKRLASSHAAEQLVHLGACDAR